MAEVLFASRALEDLDSIMAYGTGTWGYLRAEAYVQTIAQRCAWLAERPMLGRDRGDILPGLRSFPEGSHLIFYHTTSDGINVVGVPHASMDIDAYFDE